MRPHTYVLCMVPIILHWLVHTTRACKDSIPEGRRGPRQPETRTASGLTGSLPTTVWGFLCDHALTRAGLVSRGGRFHSGVV